MNENYKELYEKWFYRQLEEWGTYTWTKTNVDIVLDEKPDLSYIKEIVDFFTGIDAPILKMGNVTALYEVGYTTITKIIQATEEELIVVLGENGVKAYIGLREKLQGIPEYQLAGSLPYFGRGIGKRKLKSLCEARGDLVKIGLEDFEGVSGFDEISIIKILSGIQLYKNFLEENEGYVSVVKYKKTEGDLMDVVVCFTGVRNADLEKVIESRGGRVASSVTKDVTHLVAKDPNGTSGKLKKAKESGVVIMNINEAKDLWLE